MSDMIQAGPIAIRFLLEAEQTGGNVTMFEFSVPAQARVPVPHSHEAFDETIYGLSGTMTWLLDGKEHRVGPGEVLFIPRGHVHGFTNASSETVRQLSAITPGLLGPQYFRDIGAVVNAGGPPDIAKVMEVMRKHGLRPAPPA
ncbi:MAG TPA: cupin domain-containing protein [Candidatus Polarisedimenticolaceae bacterium]|nr:cupin domain-containing protein [Candidatus Polarisedimenticolaceae bacterium]